MSSNRASFRKPNLHRDGMHHRVGLSPRTAGVVPVDPPEKMPGEGALYGTLHR